MTWAEVRADALIDPELRSLAAQMPLVELTRKTLPAI